MMFTSSPLWHSDSRHGILLDWCHSSTCPERADCARHLTSGRFVYSLPKIDGPFFWRLIAGASLAYGGNDAVEWKEYPVCGWNDDTQQYKCGGLLGIVIQWFVAPIVALILGMLVFVVSKYAMLTAEREKSNIFKSKVGKRYVKERDVDAIRHEARPGGEVDRRVAGRG